VRFHIPHTKLHTLTGFFFYSEVVFGYIFLWVCTDELLLRGDDDDEPFHIHAILPQPFPRTHLPRLFSLIVLKKSFLNILNAPFHEFKDFLSEDIACKKSIKPRLRFSWAYLSYPKIPGKHWKLKIPKPGTHWFTIAQASGSIVKLWNYFQVYCVMEKDWSWSS